MNHRIVLGLIFLISSSLRAVSEDPKAILGSINSSSALVIAQQYTSFLDEIARGLSSANLTTADLQKQRSDWLAQNTATINSINAMIATGAPDTIESRSKLADLLAQTETQKIAAQQIMYTASIPDAAHTEQKEVVNNLMAISKDNKDLVWNSDGTHVLTVSFMAKASYEKFWAPNIVDGKLTLTDRNSWISAVPQLKNLLKAHLASGSHFSINDRARQILGVPPEKDSLERVYVEVWVKPADLLRPCADNQIDDKQCTPDFFDQGQDVFTNVTDGADTVVLTTGQKWKDWYLNERKDKYTGSWPFPWTRLGYTYDYNLPAGTPPVGASEYVTKGGAEVLVKGAYSPEEYVK